VNILRILFGTLASGIVRLLVGVGILVAAYLLVVKPVLKTTGDAIKRTDQSFERSLHGSGLDDIGKAMEGVNAQVAQEIRRSFHTAKKQGSPKRLVKCIERAHGDVHRIQRCTVKF
jgi:hypothetical protein